MAGYDIRDLFWNRYFGGAKKKIDIFELINASIVVASIEHPNVFLSRRSDIIHCLLEDDDENQATIVSPCQDDTSESDLLERELDEFVYNAPNKKRKPPHDCCYVKEDKKRRCEQENGKRRVDFDLYENKFEVSKTRFKETNQQIQRSKHRVQIVEIAPLQKLGCDGKPKRGFLSRIQKSSF